MTTQSADYMAQAARIDAARQEWREARDAADAAMWPVAEALQERARVLFDEWQEMESAT